MKILFITRESDLPETHLMMGLHAAGFDVRVVGDLLPALEARLRARGIPVDRLIIRSRTDARAIRVIRAISRDWQPHLVQCFTSRALTCAIASRLPKRVRLVAYRGAIGRLSRFDPANLFGVLHIRVNGILCLSDSIVAALRARGVPARKLFKIHKGHDPAWYSASAGPSRSRARDEVVIGFIGNMRRVKGAHILLAAARELDSSLSARVVLVGEVLDPQVAAMLCDPALRGRIEVRGFVPDASALIREFDLLVVPSLDGEGLSKAALEAMAQRVPVVASASGGLAELIEDGLSGRLVPPGDSAALARALEELARDPEARARYAEAGFARVTKVYHIDRTIEQVAAIYRELAAAAPA